MICLKFLVNWKNRPRDIRPFIFNRGFLLSVVKVLFWVINIFSPLLVFRLLLCWCERGRWWITRRWFIELFVLLWLVIEIIALRVISPSSQFNCLFLIVVAWRWIDILQSQYSLSFLGNEPRVIPARSLLLIIINYVEMIMIFAIVYFILQSYGETLFKTTIDSLEYSFRVFVPFLEINNTFPIKTVFYTEIISSIIIHLLIIQRVLAFFRR